MSKRDMSVGTDFDFDTSHFEESYTPPKKKKSEYPYIPKGTPLQLPPCRVCSGKASGIHYGVNSCEACKGFFRRYLLRKEPYKCNHGGNCEITDRHRGNCSACRMRKCLDLGMSKEGIRQGRYTLTERTKAIMEVKRLQNPELDFDQKAFDMVSAAVSQKNAERAQRLSVEDPLSCILIPTSPDCNRQQALSDISDDRSLADRLLDFSGFNTHNVSDELTDLLNPDYFFSEEMEIPSSVNMLSLDSSPCSNASPEVEIQLDLYDNVIDNLVGALNDMLPHSSQFTDEEIYAILKEGYDKYHLKAQVFGPLNALSPDEYNSVYEKTKIDVDGRKQHLQFNKGTLEKMIKKYVDFSHTIPCFSDLPAQDQATLLKASRFEFFMLLEYRSLNPDLEMIQTYSGEVFHLNEACIYVPREMMKSWLEFTRTIRKLELTNKELAVTLAVALTFRDRCRLEQPSFLEQIQDNLVRMLCYLLEDHHGDEFMMTFSRIISMLTGLRGLTENYLLQFKTICSDKFIKREMPELLGFLFDE
ncbi:vitamin D3 receptor-like isoform X2 [Ostrea edulis]|uniref:vitamin D3 receptor-like isoform X2 n=1 Tax=Ostrea edulis TaxID=37623 RepID=UPI0024AEED17|nr:vitamin D3 receptor-like isoform X2 [Ostrea edulis]